ncbi:DUF5808 domain-containing protein [Luteipulveratus mongoliensis]|uniref:Uncharacterized protein n=1 Tax=Luteipulveratus mongoliensis TaxID=571913 RepID=A0A0K1JFH2_9MICO|nr:DUF5808 domain-containing protein [Luteipulveratus mongoliensis]AKU15451.1 hypothetical protein VV02_05510 [Luteipulveratus mongoliensis]
MTKKSQEPEPPEGMLFGVPYDARRPTGKRVVSRVWNPDDRRLFTPTPFGHGHVINGYWLAHPIRYWQRRRSGGERA